MAIAFVLAAVFAPWLARNSRLFGHASMSSQSGTTLVRYYAIPFARHTSDRDLERQLEAELASTEEADEFARSSRLTEAALTPITEQPTDYGLFHLRASWPTLLGAGTRWLDDTLFGRRTTSRSTLALAIIGVNLLLLAGLYTAALLGLIELLVKRRWVLAALVAITPIYYLSISGPNSSARYRLSFLPVLVFSAGVALSKPPGSRRQERLE